MNAQTSFSQNAVLVKTNTFIRSVYNWMAVGLGLTAIVAYAVAGQMMTNPAFFQTMRTLFWVLVIAELGFVWYLSARIQKIQASTATMLFVVYAILNGATLSFIFLAYTMTSIASTFFLIEWAIKFRQYWTDLCSNIAK